MVEDTKTCTKCGVEKDIDKFYRTKKGDQFYYRNMCKDCFNAKFSRNKDYKPKVRENLEKTERNVLIEMLTEEQIENLKVLADKKNDLLNLLNKIEIVEINDKANRSIRTFNIDDNTYVKIKEHCKKTNMNISDIVNILLKRALELL